MIDRYIRLLRDMELEEKVLHTGVIICFFGLLLPWIGGQWYGSAQQWNGFGFYTGFIGHFVLVLQLYIVIIALSPLLGGPVIVRKVSRNSVRLFCSSICLILLIAAFTVLLRLTSEVSGAEIRFGIYVCIVGSTLTTLYSFLKYQEQRKNEVRQLFHHPDEQVAKPVPEPTQDEDKPPPPPPPPPLAPEEHTLFAKQ
jgi:hypothetical protein